MPDLRVPWGDGTLAVPLPAGWTLLPPAAPTLQPASADWKRELAAAIARPIAGPPLGDLLAAVGGGRVCLVVEDLTRHSPLPEILEVVLGEVRRAGLADGQVEVLFATGMHPPFSDEQARAKLGPAVGGIRWRFNPWGDPSQSEPVGQAGPVEVRVARALADADLRILVASVSPHLQAGFGGGYKMYFPGCGELSSIRQLHRTGIRRRGQGQLVGVEPDANPMRAVIDQAGQLVDARRGKTFSVQYLLDGNDLPVSPLAGETLPVHRALVETCAAACGVVQAEAADVLIANAHPRDLDLWQCFKCIPNTCWAARPGGVVICLARCPAGLNGMKMLRWPLSPRWTRRFVRILRPSTLCALVNRTVTKLAGDSQWFIRLATQIIDRNPIFMVSPQLVADGVRFPGIEMHASVEGALAAAGKRLGGGPQRMAVYPAGGISYPVSPR